MCSNVIYLQTRWVAPDSCSRLFHRVPRVGPSCQVIYSLIYSFLLSLPLHSKHSVTILHPGLSFAVEEIQAETNRSSVRYHEVRRWKKVSQSDGVTGGGPGKRNSNCITGSRNHGCIEKPEQDLSGWSMGGGSHSRTEPLTHRDGTRSHRTIQAVLRPWI